MTDAMTTAFTTIAGNITSGLTSIAPIAIAVTGAFLVWKFGARFFKGLVK